MLWFMVRFALGEVDYFDDAAKTGKKQIQSKIISKRPHSLV
jgi:hypothetical protein